jgi:hypothetical protein
MSRRIEPQRDERGENRKDRVVSLPVIGPDGRSIGMWQTCTVSECIGEAPTVGGRCFAHITDLERGHQLDLAATGEAAVNLSGVVVSNQLWQVVLNSIQRDGHADTSIIAAGAQFDEELRITGLVLDGGLSFTDAYFPAGLSIIGCMLGSLDLSRISGDTDKHWLAVYDSHINGYLGVAGMLPSVALGLTRCLVDKSVQGQSAQGRLQLEECEIGGGFDLTNAHLETLWLRDCAIKGRLDLSRADIGLFSGADLRLSSALTGRFTVGSCDLTRAELLQRPDVTITTENLGLTEAHFPAGGRIEIGGGVADLTSMSAGASLTIRGSDGAAVGSLRNCDLAKVTFAKIDLGDCAFSQTHGLDSVKIEPSTTMRSAPRGRFVRRCVLDEFIWRGTRSAWWRKGWEISRQPRLGETLPKPTPSEIAGIYRALRKGLEDQSDQPGAEEFYYGEMEMRRLNKNSSRSQRTILNLYWLSSGYGLRAGRALTFLAAVISVGGLLLDNFGFVKQVSGLPLGLLTAAESALPGLRISTDLTEPGRAVSLCLRIICPVLIGLSALAIRNRVKR